ncbi:MAG TPA: hypothetical protein VGO91_04485 [Pyrinomonadaceae bacterium]|jgi:hypothetical protein|nr:hypothetical protein [Pyrinomonadaceae bacterium]
MKRILRAVALLGVLMLTASAVFAQSERGTIVNIPFAFNVGEKTLPAGDYRIQPYRRDTDKVWLIQNQEQHAGTFVMTIPVRSNTTRDEGQMIFHRYGEQYFLSQVWTPCTSTGVELPVSRQERAVEVASTTERQTYVLTAHRD